jgi:CheY-like chemotaxis protein
METTPIHNRGLILSVDDDEDDIHLMKLLFRKAGLDHPLQVYPRGDELMAALSGLLKKSMKAVMPLLCFIDINMPVLGGHAILRWIRKHPQFDPISVVMMSSSEHPDDVKEAAEAGAQCYLAKYPQPAVLRRVVEEAERVAGAGAAREWFGLPANLLLRWGASGK